MEAFQVLPTAALETLSWFDAEEKYKGEFVEHGGKDYTSHPWLFM